ncbi:choice-of-anchor I family protein [Chryseobacterium manosquense]|uniref:Choice-of-anchor I family protein n=1 Tax=Chryseobacterium manosquense TaxID=2754694 RepID=A0A7H1DTI0_9FLAO|nr:choice-of-anchor I family protein [Chryseobacterium manosquense]QNS40288.1 choice-of-anchor I family protein [Chryseobacterium manosquense]
MRKLYLIQLFTIIFSLSFQSVNSQTLVHYWNFNNNSSLATISTPNVALVPGASLQAIPGGSSVIDFAGGTGQNFNVENLNARNGDISGTHLRFNNPIGGALQFDLPTTGYKNVVVKFTTRRSGSGAGTQLWSFSIDGNNFIPFATIFPVDGNPNLQTLDFSTIANVSNNPNFKLKVEFSAIPGGSVGNNRFDNFTLDATPEGIDTTAPVVTYNPPNSATNVATTVKPKISFNENIRLIDNSEITNPQDLVELRLGNSTGSLVPFFASFSNNEITVNPIPGLDINQTYYLALKPNMVEDFSDNAVVSSTSSIFTTAGTSVSFAKNFVKVQENAGSLIFDLNISSPSNATVDLVVKVAPFSTANSGDFTLATQTIQITPSTPVIYNISIPIIDDQLEEQQAEYFVVSLENPVGTTISGSSFATIFIIDNDKLAPIPNNQISLNYIGSFDPSGSNNSTTEIVVHDPISKRLFTTSAVSGLLDIVDFSNPSAPSVISSIDMNAYGGLTSVAVKNGIVAVASPNSVPQNNGSVVFFDTNGNFINKVTVGALPDMITFTPDGSKVLTANEGEPNADYSLDPEGSVSIIDVSGGISTLSQSNVTTLLFTDFNSQEASLLASGIRKLKASSTLSQDLKPEYIAVNSDNQKAFVTIQENNAIAEINLNYKTIAALWALGKKDMSLPGNGFDASDNNNEILIANWPVKTFYIPDAVATYNVGGTNYLVTANEGDEKEFSNLNERTTLGASSYALDPAIFPQSEVLKASHNLGRFRVTNLNGNTDSDAAFEEINAVGSRSFSIFNADTKQIVFDSGDDFERYTAQHFTNIFNADHESNTPKNRSRSKGPEPEGVTIAKISNETFAFISLERVGGVMVYNISNPNAPVFVDYKNTRSTSAYGGDNGAEGITYIPKTESATGKGYIVIANEISGTLTIYEINDDVLDSKEATNTTKTFAVFPNPAPKGLVYFNRAADVEIYDMAGKLVQKSKNAKTIDTTTFSTGVYLIKTSEGMVKRMIVK